MNAAGVYRIVNIITGRTYIGSSANVEDRLRTHRLRLCRGAHGNPHLQASWNKHSGAVFVFESLTTCERADLIQREQAFIDAYFEHDLPLYNQRPTVKSTAGFSMSKEMRAKISAKALGNLRSVGRKHSADTLAKIGAKSRGRQHTMETRMQMSITRKGQKKSLEMRAKLSAAKMGHPVSQETREKLRVFFKGQGKGQL